jgi:hypothetical protein
MIAGDRLVQILRSLWLSCVPGKRRQNKRDCNLHCRIRGAFANAQTLCDLLTRGARQFLSNHLCDEIHFENPFFQER